MFTSNTIRNSFGSSIPVLTALVAVNISESVALLPVLLIAVSTALTLAKEDKGEEKNDTMTNDIMGCRSCWDLTQGAVGCSMAVSVVVDSSVLESSSSANNECHLLFAEWTSSAGVVFCCVVTYVLLIMVTNTIACYKFICTWNLIAESLRNNHRLDHHRNSNNSKHEDAATLQRRMCQEALAVSQYHQTDENNGLAATRTTCPICLIDLQDQDLIVSCNDGCYAVFHKDCLFQWLEHKLVDDLAPTDDDETYNNCEKYPTSCPCCRKDLIGFVRTTTPAYSSSTESNWLTDLSTFMGYYPR